MVTASDRSTGDNHINYLSEHSPLLDIHLYSHSKVKEGSRDEYIVILYSSTNMQIEIVKSL